MRFVRGKNWRRQRVCFLFLVFFHRARVATWHVPYACSGWFPNGCWLRCPTDGQGLNVCTTELTTCCVLRRTLSRHAFVRLGSAYAKQTGWRLDPTPVNLLAGGLNLLPSLGRRACLFGRGVSCVLFTYHHVGRSLFSLFAVWLFGERTV